MRLALPAPTNAWRRAVRSFAYAVPPVTAIACGVTICPMAWIGIPCPGCGMTRAAVALAGGHLAEATVMNPLALVAVPLSAALAFFGVYSYISRGTSRMGERIPMTLGVGLSAALAVVWALRWFGAFGGPVPV